MRNLHAEWRRKHRSDVVVRQAQDLMTEKLKAIVAERIARLDLAVENLNQQSQALESRWARR